MAILYLATGPWHFGQTLVWKTWKEKFCESPTEVKPVILPGITFHGLQWGFTEFFFPSFLYCLPKNTLDNISSDMNLFYLLMQDYKTSQKIWCSIHVLINTDIHCTVYRFCHYGKMNNFFISLNSIITIIINLTEN